MTMGYIWVMESKRPRLVVGVLARRRQKYLLIKEKIEGGKEWWLVPGGGVEWGETLEQAVKRELLEETNLKLKKAKFLTHKEAVFPKFGYHALIMFFETSVRSGKPKFEKKAIASGWFTAKEAKKLVLVDSAKWLFEESGLIQ